MQFNRVLLILFAVGLLMQAALIHTTRTELTDCKAEIQQLKDNQKRMLDTEMNLIRYTRGDLD